MVLFDALCVETFEGPLALICYVCVLGGGRGGWWLVVGGWWLVGGGGEEVGTEAVSSHVEVVYWSRLRNEWFPEAVGRCRNCNLPPKESHPRHIMGHVGVVEGKGHLRDVQVAHEGSALQAAWRRMERKLFT